MTEYLERLLAEINRLDNQAASVCDLIAPDEPLFSKAGAVRLFCKEAVSLLTQSDDIADALNNGGDDNHAN